VQPPGVADREYLGDRAAGVVRDEVDAGQFERVAEACDEPRQARQREVLAGGGRSVPVQRQVDRHAAALATDLIDNVPPQVSAGANAVEEQCGAARPAGIDIAGWTRRGADLAAVFVEAFHLAEHRFLPRMRGRQRYSDRLDRLTV
jgi:hypothetical protein